MENVHASPALIASQKGQKPLGWTGSLFLFGVPALAMFASFHLGIPALKRAGLTPFEAFIVANTAPMALLLAAALAGLVREQAIADLAGLRRALRVRMRHSPGGIAWPRPLPRHAARRGGFGLLSRALVGAGVIPLPQTLPLLLDPRATLAAHGIAALVFDKRGTGASSGDWRTAVLQDLIDDGLAGLGALREQPEVAPAQVGLIGYSQGAWLLPFAAAQREEVAFIISVTGSATTLAAQEMWGVGNDLAARGFSERAIRTTMKGMHLLFSTRPFIRRGLLPLQHLWFNSYDPFLDPAAAWPDVEQPALLVYAGQDRLVPTADSIGLVEEALAGGHPLSRVAVFPGMGHALGGAALGYLLNADANETATTAVPFCLFLSGGALLYLAATGYSVAVFVPGWFRGEATSLSDVVFNSLSILFLLFLGYWGVLGLPL